MTKESLKHLIKTIFLILLFSIIIDKIVFLALNKISDNVFSGQALGKLNHYLKIKNEIDFIVFGSSRANHSVNPIEINKNSFNMGVDGTKIAYSTALLKLLPKQKEQIILFHIDPENVFDDNYQGDDIKGLITKFNRNEIIKNEIIKLNKNNNLQDFYWSLSYNGKVLGILKNYFKPNYKYQSYSGFDPIKVTEVQRRIFKNILKNERNIQYPKELTLNKIYNNSLDEIKLFCLDNNKKIIFFTSPKFNDYYKDDNIKLSQIMKNKEIIYFDLTDFFKNKNDIVYWKDLTHLSDIGAEIFTDSLKTSLSCIVR